MKKNPQTSAIRLICTVEHLPALDPSLPGREAFSLNLSTAWDGNLSDLGLFPRLLKPWDLKAIDKIRVTLIKNGVPENPAGVTFQQQNFRSLPVSPMPSPTGFPRFHNFTNKLGTYLTTTATGAFDPDRLTAIQAGQRNEWPTLLAQAATLPFPIPQLANLSFIFTLPNSAITPGTIVFAAPVVEFDDQQTGSHRLDPSSFEVTANGRYAVWKYDDTVTPPSSQPASPVPAAVEAYIGKCELVPDPVQGSYLNLKTLWVNISNTDLNPADWRAELEEKMAASMDLSLRIIEWVKQINGGTPAVQLELQKNIGVYVDMFLAALRDNAGIGFRPGPNGKNLLGTLGVPMPHTAHEVNLSGWKGLVAKALPELDKLSILSDKLLINPVTDIIAEMNMLHASIFDPANLRAIVKAQWAAHSPAAYDVPDSNLRNINLRNELARENLGLFWDAFRNSGLTDLEAVKKTFKCLFQAYCYKRFNHPIDPAVAADCQFGTFGDFQQVFPQFTPDISKVNSLSAHVAAWSAESWGLNTPPAGTLEEPTPVAHNLSVQVASVASSAVSGVRDPLEAINGVGILIKQRDDTRWTCLNMAEVRHEKDAPEPLFDFPVMVASPITYVNGLRSPNPTYSNQPLVATSPLSRMTGDYRLTGTRETFQDTNQEFKRLVYFDFSIKPEARMRALKFGRSYQLQPFIVSAGGAIPPALARNSPGGFCDLDINSAAVPTGTTPAQYNYQRKVRVGQVRVQSNDDTNCIPEIPVPPNVFPRLRDTGLLNRPGPSRNANSGRPDLLDQQDNHEKPLLFLVPANVNSNYTSSVSFKLRLPSVEVNTWDRWVMNGTINRQDKLGVPTYIENLRKGVWRDYKARVCTPLPEKNECVKIDPATDVTMDDPALAPVIYVELLKLNENGSLQPVNAFPVNIGLNLPAAVTADMRLKSVQSAPVTVDCNATDGDERLEFTGGKLVCTVMKGASYCLRASACLPVEYLSPSGSRPALFDRIYDATQPNSVVNGNLKTGTFELFIEVATDNLPTEADLTSKFNVRFVPSAADGAGNGDYVHLKLSETNGSLTEFPYLYRAEVYRQLWRWQGRNTQPHPQILNTSNIQGSQPETDWEIVEFSNRDDLDYSIASMDSNVSIPAVPPTGPATFGSGKRTFEYREHLTGASARAYDLRAHHYRFRIKVYSRYEGVLQTSYREPPNWKSVFVPCRVRKEVPAPKVKFILPLTQSFNSANTSSTAGLLLVLDEPWHEVGGIAEGLSAAVTWTEAGIAANAGANSNSNSNSNTNANSNSNSNSDSNALDRNYQYQAGYNPIYNAAGIQTHTVEFVENSSDGENSIIGPIGHTYDRNRDFPYIGSTSFIIPPPKIDGAVRPFNWGMCQIKFKRHVTSSRKNTDGTFSHERISSAYCDPLWVEYLPEFTSHDRNRIDTAKYRIALRGNALALADRQDFKNPGSDLKLPDDRKDFNVFRYYLVLTREVFDISGRKGQLAYIGILTPSDAGELWTPLSPAPALSSLMPGIGEGEYFAQILCVQRHKNAVLQPTFNADEFWDALFSRSVEDTRRMRIVSVSEPISDDEISTECTSGE